LETKNIKKEVIEAILKIGWCDSHIHFERILRAHNEISQPDTGDYVPELFIRKYFRYVNILDLFEQYFSKNEYPRNLSEVFFYLFFF